MEGGTFHNPQLAKLLRGKAVESRLHMDFPGQIEPDHWVVQRRLQRELIGNRGMPYYAIVDPENNEFLYRLYISGEGRDGIGLFGQLRIPESSEVEGDHAATGAHQGIDLGRPLLSRKTKPVHQENRRPLPADIHGQGDTVGRLNQMIFTIP